MDYRDTAAKLRVKAADRAVTPSEAAALRAKADELEARYGKAAPTPPEPPRTHAPDPPAWPAWVYVAAAYWADIVEDAFGGNDVDYGSAFTDY
jgi:hypothetical protein